MGQLYIENLSPIKPCKALCIQEHTQDFSTTKEDVCIEFSTANLFVLKPETLHKLLQMSLSELRIHTAEYYADMKII